MRSYAFLALLLGCLACTDGKNQSSTNTTSADSVQNVNSADTPGTSGQEPLSKDEIQELGLLREVDDMGYPMVSLTIEFPERKRSEYFTVNVESIEGVDIQKLRSWSGQFVSFRYTSQLVNALLDVQYKGKSVLGEYAPEINSEMRKVEGILDGADEETPGDLPGSVTITTPDKNTLTFPFFVTAEMVEANGHRVVGYYEPRPEYVVSAIRKADRK